MGEITFQKAESFILMTESIMEENEFFFTGLRQTVIKCLKSGNGKEKVYNDIAISKTGVLLSLSDISVQLKNYTDSTQNNLVMLVSDDVSCTTRCGVLKIPDEVKLVALNAKSEDCKGWEEISDSVEFRKNVFTYNDLSELNPVILIDEITNTINCSNTEFNRKYMYTIPTKKPVLPNCENEALFPTQKTDTDSSQNIDVNEENLTTNIVIGCLAGLLVIVFLACLFVFYKNRKGSRGPETYRQYSQVDQSVASHEHKLPSIADAYPTTGNDGNHVESVEGWQYEELHIPTFLDIEDPSDRRLSSTRFIPRGPLISSEEDDNLNIPFGSGNEKDVIKSDDSNPFFVLKKPDIATENESREGDDIVNAKEDIKSDDLDTENNHVDKNVQLANDLPRQTESESELASEGEKTVIETTG